MVTEESVVPSKLVPLLLVASAPCFPLALSASKSLLLIAISTESFLSALLTPHFAHTLSPLTSKFHSACYTVSRAVAEILFLHLFNRTTKGLWPTTTSHFTPLLPFLSSPLHLKTSTLPSRGHCVTTLPASASPIRFQMMTSLHCSPENSDTDASSDDHQLPTITSSPDTDWDGDDSESPVSSQVSVKVWPSTHNISQNKYVSTNRVGLDG